MGREKLIKIIENGKQVGISKMIKKGGTSFAYTYAIQKINSKYIVYMDEYDLDSYYADEMDKETQKTVIYDHLTDFINNFSTKYGVTFEDFNISKGQRYFNADLFY